MAGSALLRVPCVTVLSSVAQDGRLAAALNSSDNPALSRGEDCLPRLRSGPRARSFAGVYARMPRDETLRPRPIWPSCRHDRRVLCVLGSALGSLRVSFEPSEFPCRGVKAASVMFINI